MSKAILVMDTPSVCITCPLCHKTEMVHIGNFEYRQLYECEVQPHDVENKYLKNILYEKPNWCPLKEVPEKYDLNEEFTYEDMWDADEKWAFENGYNACLK